MHFKAENILRKRLLFYRAIRYRGGYGVHSPFVFNLITKVIEEHCPFYAFNEIELLRSKLHYQKDQFAYTDHKNGNISCRDTIANIVEKQAIRPKQGKLLFRLANYFKAKRIIQLGSSVGISTVYLTAYAKDIKCILLEKDKDQAAIARNTFSKLTYNPIDLRIGEYADLFSQALKEMESPDIVFFNNLPDEDLVKARTLFEEALKYAGDQTLIIIPGIQTSPAMRKFWQSLSDYPEVRVTMDLFSMGLVIFNPKLHKRNYIVYL